MAWSKPMTVKAPPPVEHLASRRGYPMRNHWSRWIRHQTRKVRPLTAADFNWSIRENLAE